MEGGGSAINKVNEPEHDSPIFTMPPAGCQNKEGGKAGESLEGSFLLSFDCHASSKYSYYRVSNGA